MKLILPTPAEANLSLSLEQLKKYKAYASKVYRSLKYNIRLKFSEEDFIQEFFVYVFKYPDKPLSYVVRRIIFENSHCIEYDILQIENAMKFCDLVEQNDKGGFDLLTSMCSLYCDSFDKELYIDDSESILNELSYILYSKESFRQEFFDYMHGQSIGKSKQKGCREKLFRNRFKILSFLYQKGRFDYKTYEYFLHLAQNMKKPASVPKVLSMTSTAISNRKYYETHKNTFNKNALL